MGAEEKRQKTKIIPGTQSKELGARAPPLAARPSFRQILKAHMKIQGGHWQICDAQPQGIYSECAVRK